MTAKGNFTAYQALTPLKGSIADDIQVQEENGFKRRQLKMQEDQLADAKAEREQKRKNELRDKVAKNLNNYDTGSRSLNELQGRLIQKAMTEYGPIIETLESKTSTEQEKLRAQLKLQNLQDLPDNLKRVTDFYTQQDAAYKKGVLSGSLWKNPDYEKIFQTGFENYHLDLDDDGLPIVAFTDKNKDGKVDILDVQDYEQIKTGLPTFDFQPRYDYDALMKDATTKIQPDVSQTDNGSVQVKTTGLDLVKAEGYAKNLLVKSDGSPTPEMLSIAKERGLDATKPENQKTIIADFVRDMSTRTKSGKEETRKESNLAREKFNFEKSQAAKKEKETSLALVETPPVYEEAKVRPAKGYQTVAVSNSKPVPLVQLYVPGDKNKENPTGKREITNGTINSYTVTKDKLGRRRVYVEMVYQDSKSSTLTQDELAMLDNPSTPDDQRELLLTKQSKGPENKSVVGYMAEKDLSKFAKQNKLTTTQLANKARAGKEQNERPKTVVQNGITYTWNEAKQTYE